MPAPSAIGCAMSGTALLIFAFAICGVGALTAFTFSVLGRLVTRFRSRRRTRQGYSAELPTWGMLYRESLAREYTQANRRDRLALLRSFRRVKRAPAETTSRAAGETSSAISRTLSTHS